MLPFLLRICKNDVFVCAGVNKTTGSQFPLINEGCGWKHTDVGGLQICERQACKETEGHVFLHLWTFQEELR